YADGRRVDQVCECEVSRFGVTKHALGVDDAVGRKLFTDDAKHFLGFTCIGKIARIEIARKVDFLCLTRQTDHVASFVGQPPADRPPDALCRARHQDTLVLHQDSPAKAFIPVTAPVRGDAGGSIRRGTRCASAQSSSYPTVPAACATASTDGPPSPHSTTGEPTVASGIGVRSTASISMDTRPSSRVARPATVTGVPVPACRG